VQVILNNNNVSLRQLEEHADMSGDSIGCCLYRQPEVSGCCNNVPKERSVRAKRRNVINRLSGACPSASSSTTSCNRRLWFKISPGVVTSISHAGNRGKKKDVLL
jgi:hypothetical protein